MLEGSSASLDLTRGTTSANFQTCANVFEEKKVLTGFVIPARVHLEIKVASKGILGPDYMADFSPG